MSAYGIHIYNFEFWEGPTPRVATQHVMEHHRPGAAGTALHLLGSWGDKFECVLTSHYAGQLPAASAAHAMRLMIGSGWYPLKYNNLNYTGLTGTGYHVLGVDVLDLRSHILLKGPGYSYPLGCALVTRFTLVPEAL
jgi:hypothetical protein